jgi:uncharacterized protein YbjT (DUF2867 family)
MATILVTGASGTIGSRTVERLAAMPGVTVRATLHARPAALPKNVQAFPVDYDRPETVRAAAAGADAAFLITPAAPNQADLASRLVAAVSAGGVPRLVRLSVIGAEWEDRPQFMEDHARTEHEITAAGIPATFLRPNSFLSNFLLHFRPDPEGNIRLPWGDAAVSFIDPRDVADVAARVLTSEGHAGKAYTLTGPETATVSEVASVISKATGRSIRYVDTPEETMRQGMLAHGMPPRMVQGLMELFAAHKSGRTAPVTSTLRELTGRPGRTLSEFARDHAEGWATR